MKKEILFAMLVSVIMIAAWGCRNVATDMSSRTRSFDEGWLFIKDNPTG
jgi:hypothetical protein